jgi:hypothetical protein
VARAHLAGHVAPPELFIPGLREHVRDLGITLDKVVNDQADERPE